MMSATKVKGRRPQAARCCAFLLFLCASNSALRAEGTTFPSPALGKDVPCKVTEPGNGGAAATVIYLQNLSVPRLGTESDDAILHDLREAGDRVVVVDYGHDPNAVSPKLNADLLAMRTQIGAKKFLGDLKIDPAHVYILAEGFRLKRDVEFYRAGGAGARVLAMDILYPAKPKSPAPVLMEITCDNANRMGNSSLVFCHDTLIEGGELAGFAGVMIDHPIAPPYKGLDDPMPLAISELKSAVRTLRFEGKSLGLSDNIGTIGFSRGAEMAAILAVTNGNASLEGDIPPGLHKEMSSRVQAALIHGARYDLTAIGPDDPMYKRFEKAWGKREDDPAKWAMHGPAYYLPKDAETARQTVAPMFLNTSDKESNEFREGLLLFSKRLDDLGVEHVLQLDQDGRGHRVTTDPATLSRIYAFFAKHLNG